jgi:hypothetical protein
MTVVYAVTAAFVDAAVAEEWLRWLGAGHVAAVLAAGATDAEVVELDGGPGRRFEVRYHFPTREAFARYEREHAPRLRAEGLSLFPPDRGIAYSRTVGEVRRAYPDSSCEPPCPPV